MSTFHHQQQRPKRLVLHLLYSPLLAKTSTSGEPTVIPHPPPGRAGLQEKTSSPMTPLEICSPMGHPLVALHDPARNAKPAM